MILAALVALAIGPPAEIPLSEFAARRVAVRAKLGNAALLVFAKTEKEAEADRNGLYPDPNFYYLTGIREPGPALLLTADSEILFVPARNAHREKYTGPRLSPGTDAAAATGVASVREEGELAAILADTKKLYAETRSQERIRQLRPQVEFADAAKLLAPLRMKKSPSELARIERAAEASMAAHRAAWQRMSPGVFEYQVAAAFTNSFLEQGCQRHAFAPIVGSGRNGTVLHYSDNSRRMDAGELVVIDAAAECALYASDITRTVPVNGKFTARQRELYNAVLRAERAVVAAARPGVTVKQLKQIAIDSLNRESPPLGAFLPHGVSHHLGLEVHDEADNDLPLEPGHVITIEPGVYLPDERIGIRIEDMVVITDKGCRVLTAGLPVEAAAIEKEMARGR